MAIKLYQENNEGSTKALIIGITTEDVAEWTKDGVKKAVVKLKDRAGEITTVYFNNSPSGPQMADRILKTGMQKGTPLTILCYLDETKNVATGLDFKFKKGVWTFSTEKGDVNVLFGTICGQREISTTAVACSLPVAVWNKETKANDEYFASVSFYDNEDDEKRKYASFARRLLFKMDDTTGKWKKTTGAIVCGSLNKKTADNGNVYMNYPGWRIEVVDFEV